MLRVRQYIAARQAAFGEHPFLRRLGETPPLSRALPFVSQASFFVLAFQDLMRMIGEQATDPRLRHLLQQHCEEEVGHEKWFLHDVVRLVGKEPGVTALFGPKHAPTRKATYALAAETLAARDDVERLALLLTMEGTSEVSFGALEAYFRRVGVADGLVFFAGPHLEAEKDHAVFEDAMAMIVAAIELDDEARARAVGVVDRTYAAFDVMLNGLAHALSGAEAA